MIPTSEQLEQVSRARQGALNEVPFAVLLLALSVHHGTLVVEVRRKQISKRIMFENGVPIDCRSNLVHETLGRYMVGEGKLAADDLHSYLGQSAASGVPLGEVLLDHGVVTAEELYKLLQQNLAKKLLDVFTWRDGEFVSHDETPRPESSLKVRVPQLIVTGITKFAPQEEVDVGVVPLVGKKLCLHPNPPYALEEIRLTPRQSQVAVALRSGWRIDELALGTGMPFEEITRLLYALAVLGVVVTEDHPAARGALRAARATNPTAPGAAASPAPPPGEPTGAAASPVPPPGEPTGAAAATAPPPAGEPATAGAVPPPAGESAAAAAASAASAAPPPAGEPAATAAARPGAPVPASGSADTAAPADAASPAPSPTPPLPLAPAAPSGAPTPPGERSPTAPSTPPNPPHPPHPPTAASTPALSPFPSPAPTGTAVHRHPTSSTQAIAIPPPSLLAEDQPPTPAPPPAPSPAVEGRRNAIMQAYLSYRRLDAFDLLGTDEDASPAGIETRFLEFAERFTPWAFNAPGLADMQEKVRDLFLAGARAYGELLDLERRNVLIFRRRTAREERDRRQPAGDALAIKTDLLDPEVQYRKGRSLLEAGKFQDAAMLLEFASDCDPQNGLYSAELAYCRFCIDPGHGTRYLKDLKETLRRDPRCGLAAYYSGEIHRQMGHVEEAETALRRAIKMMAPDRRPIEALKLLSAEKHR